MSVSCLSVCVPLRKPCFPVDWRLLVKERICIIGISLKNIWCFFLLWCFSEFWIFWVFGPLHTSLLCLVGELAGGGAVAVAVGDTQHVTCDTLHVTNEMWYVTCDTRHIIYIFFFLSVCFWPFWYWCYYPHTSRYSVSPVCEISSSSFGWASTIRSNKFLFSIRYSRWLLMFCLKLRYVLAIQIERHLSNHYKFVLHYFIYGIIVWIRLPLVNSNSQYLICEHYLILYIKDIMFLVILGVFLT